MQIEQQKKHQERGTTRPAHVSVPRYFLTDKACKTVLQSFHPSKPREHNLEKENYK